MINIGIHEYFRIFLPAVIFIALLKALTPDLLPSQSGHLILLSAWVGLLVAPIADKLAKRWFHRQTIRTNFYERFINKFAQRARIKLENGGTKKLTSFSGELGILENKKTLCIIEAYKMFSRQGWGGEADAYRVRTEKSFGILYYSMFFYIFVAVILIVANAIIGFAKMKYLSNNWFFDTGILLLAMIIMFWEATGRFRMSLNNELLVLEAHYDTLKKYYDGIIDEEQKDSQ